MTIKTITFQQTFPTGQFQNQKLGVEIAFDREEDVSPSEVFEQAKKIVNDAFEAINPQIEWNNAERPMFHPATQENAPTPRQEKIEGMKSIIKLCSTQSFLEKQRKNVEEISDPELTQAFEKRLKELVV